MSPPKDIAPGVAVAGQPTPADVADMAARGYRTIIGNRPDAEEPGQSPSAEIRAEAERLGLAYVPIPVTSGTIGVRDVAAFDRALQESPKPVVAHCRSGTRSYLLWAAAQALHHGADPQALVAEAAANGYDIKSLPDLVARLRQEGGG